MNIAITGSIGSGKSYVTAQLKQLLGALHCDTDVVCRDLLLKENPGWQGVVARWGERFLLENGEIDRSTLRSAIFAEDEIRLQLESILHPLVRQHVQRLTERARNKGLSLIVEIPLLFETGWQNEFNYVITVFAGVEECIERVMRRDNVSRQQVIKILKTQMDIKEKKKLSDFVIDNSGDKEKTMVQVKTVSTEILKNVTLKKS